MSLQRAYQIGLGETSRPLAIHRFGVDWRQGQSCFQQGCDQQTMPGFHHTGNVIKGSNTTQATHQFRESFRRVLHVQLGHFATRFIDDDEIMMAISPVYSCKPHDTILVSTGASWSMGVLLRGGRLAFFQSSLASRNTLGKLLLSLSVEPGGENALSLARPCQHVYQPAETLCKRAWLSFNVEGENHVFYNIVSFEWHPLAAG